MSLKRKRNIKLENTSTYNVFMADTFNEEELEDYEENKATGMEEEEEKELHLVNVIEGKDNAIPLPVIKEIQNPAYKFYAPLALKKFINWQKDVPNTYIMTKEDQSQIEEMKSKYKTNTPLLKAEIDPMHKLTNSISTENVQCFDVQNAIRCFGDDPKHYGNIKIKEFVDFILKRCIIRHEKSPYEAYLCFKPRVIIPKIKSRKNEMHVSEKLSLMHQEFSDLHKLCELTMERNEIEDKIFEDKIKMIGEFGDIFCSRIRKKLTLKRPKSEISEIFFTRKKLKTGASLREPFLDGIFFDEKLVNLCDKNTNVAVKEEFATEKPDKSCFENRFECEIE